MSVAAGVRDAAMNVRDKLRGGIGQTKVKRYWPGKAPDWAEEQEEEPENKALEPSEIVRQDVRKSFKEDSRLRRLAESRRDRDEAVANHREIRAAEIVSTREEERRASRREEEEDLEEDEDAIEERRRRAREKALQRQQEEELAKEEEEEEDEEESEYETDSEDEGGGITLIKPVFVPKSERETVAEKEKLEAEEEAMQEAVKRRLEERKVETKQIVVEKIREEEVIEKNREVDGDGEDVDTDDEINEADEYELWKSRELGRLRRDREEREAMVKEKEEVERLRGMTEEERREYEKKNPRQTSVAPKKKWKFMQKYFHKGAFFQDSPDDRGGTAGDAEIYRRDFSAPTGDDKMDRTVLPKVMQVKHFGRSGRTKWSHLVAEDTTEWDNPWTYNDQLRAKYNSKMGGMGVIEKPKGSKKLKDWDVK
eukprot:jgi/Mesen1/3104/ME000184S02165